MHVNACAEACPVSPELGTGKRMLVLIFILEKKQCLREIVWCSICIAFDSFPIVIPSGSSRKRE